MHVLITCPPLPHVHAEMLSSVHSAHPKKISYACSQVPVYEKEYMLCCAPDVAGLLWLHVAITCPPPPHVHSEMPLSVNWPHSDMTGYQVMTVEKHISISGLQYLQVGVIIT